ncbi:MAG: DUF6165 family protein [Bdellovibrionales bacterium]|nr:DUF6165 family protein [Bdellovibrionales bacterium]
MELNIPVSLGEVIDKVSILRIKKQKISDQQKLKFIRDEESRLVKFLNQDKSYLIWIERLVEVNQALWEVEDNLREKEKANDFGEDFILLARSVYILNDQRFEIKNKINSLFNSSIREVKSYSSY